MAGTLVLTNVKREPIRLRITRMVMGPIDSVSGNGATKVYPTASAATVAMAVGDGWRDGCWWWDWRWRHSRNMISQAKREIQLQPGHTQQLDCNGTYYRAD